LCVNTYYMSKKNANKVKAGKVGKQKLKNGLTVKEIQFAKEFLKTGNASQAAKKIYSDYSPNTIPSKQNALLKKEAMQDYVLSKLENNDVDLNFIISGLKKNILTGLGVDSNAQSANKALMHLWKIYERVIANPDTKKQATGDVYINYIQEVQNLTHEEIVDKRNELSGFFDKIDDAEVVETPKTKSKD